MHKRYRFNSIIIGGASDWCNLKRYESSTSGVSTFNERCMYSIDESYINDC